MPSGCSLSKDKNMTENMKERDIAVRSVPVLLPLPFDEAFDYSVSTGLAVEAGDFVAVPLGATKRVGVVWPDDEGKPLAASKGVASSKLKPIEDTLDLPPMPAASRQFVSWLSRYTMAPLGSVMRMVMGSPHNLKPSKLVTGYHLIGPPPDRMTKARARVIDVLADGPSRSMPDIMETAGVSRAVVTGLVDHGTLGTLELPEMDAASDEIDLEHMRDNSPVLSDTQQDGVEALCDGIEEGGYQCTLLEGVTGSGKTEVYFEAIARTLEQDPTAQIVVMVPEIALTNQLLSRFEARFGTKPRAWHSGLTAKERRAHWRAIISGRGRVVVGARSALMLPFANLRLIVIDEEHDPSYKQEEQVVYHARDMAVVRASIGNCPLVLVSATPSLETVSNCQQGRYKHVVLPERHGGAQLPDMAAIDMRTQDMPSNQWISPTLAEALRKTLEDGEQSLLFLNRRGYAPAAICRGCGHRLQRENCSAPLVVHRYGNRLQCHHCDYSIPMPTECPNCAAEGAIVVCGPGVERLAEEVMTIFPDARVGIMASDNMRSPRETQDFIAQIERHEIDIVVGTQLVAKGHHFPMLTMVGVVDADLGLSGGDLRAAERTWQQLWQVAGRAGRAERPGRVFLQTYMPEHPVMQALIKGDGPGFYASETAQREQHHMPPFGRLAAVILSGRDGGAVASMARQLSLAIPIDPKVTVMGPAPAPYAVLRGRHRQRFLVKTERGYNIQQYLRHWLPDNRQAKGVRISVDVDPYSFL